MSSVERKTVIAAMEMAYDYYSARTLLKRHLRDADLDSELQVFDASALRLLIESLRAADGERVGPVIDLLGRRTPEPQAEKKAAPPEKKAAAAPMKKTASSTSSAKKKTKTTDAEPKKSASSSKKSSSKKKKSTTKTSSSKKGASKKTRSSK